MIGKVVFKSGHVVQAVQGANPVLKAVVAGTAVLQVQIRAGHALVRDLLSRCPGDLLKHLGKQIGQGSRHRAFSGTGAHK